MRCILLKLPVGNITMCLLFLNVLANLKFQFFNFEQFLTLIFSTNVFSAGMEISCTPQSMHTHMYMHILACITHKHTLKQTLTNLHALTLAGTLAHTRAHSHSNSLARMYNCMLMHLQTYSQACPCTHLCIHKMAHHCVLSVEHLKHFVKRKIHKLRKIQVFT